MGTVVELAKGYIDQELSKTANEIYQSMVFAVYPHSKSGAALGALHVERLSDVSYFIGANVGSGPNDGGLHVLWLNDGNGGLGKRLYPTRKKALNTPYGPKASVSAHGGIHFVEKIASRYR